MLNMPYSRTRPRSSRATRLTKGRYKRRASRRRTGISVASLPPSAFKLMTKPKPKVNHLFTNNGYAYI